MIEKTKGHSFNMEQKKENVKWLYHNSIDQLCATEPTTGPIVLSCQLYELDQAIHHEVTRTPSDYCEVKRLRSKDSMTIQGVGINCKNCVYFKEVIKDGTRYAKCKSCPQEYELYVHQKMKVEDIKVINFELNNNMAVVTKWFRVVTGTSEQHE